MILSILRGQDPRLRMTAKDFRFPEDLAALDDLGDTFRASDARGLAATQIGAMCRAFYMRPERGGQLILCINPVIVSQSSIYWTQEERCLSFPWLNNVKISRPHSGVLDYRDRNNQLHRKGMSGWDFRCVLHEIDHLNGITIDQRRRESRQPPKE